MSKPELTEAQFQAASAHDAFNVYGIVKHLQGITGGRVPDIAVICGSGLSELHEILSDRVAVPYSTIPGFPLSTVQGQVGELVFGQLGPTYVVLMRGRFHFYEVRAPVFVNRIVFALKDMRAWPKHPSYHPVVDSCNMSHRFSPARRQLCRFFLKLCMFLMRNSLQECPV